MTRLIASAVAAIALAVPAAATADIPTPATRDPAPQAWQAVLPAALAARPTAPNCPQGVNLMAAAFDPAYGAAAPQGGCDIWINSTTDDGRFSAHDRCILEAHEIGHLLQTPGSQQHFPGTIMGEDTSIYQTPVPSCDALRTATDVTASLPVAAAVAAPPSNYLSGARARTAMRARIGARWRVYCLRYDTSVVDCRGRRGSHERRLRLTRRGAVVRFQRPARAPGFQL